MRLTLLPCGALACVLLAALLAPSQSNPPADTKAAPAGEPAPRRVVGNVVTSDSLPALSLKFDRAFKYAGTQTFILYDVARAEQHFFVDADPSGQIRRLYWVQFENYIPGNTFKYDYGDVKQTVNLGGFRFHTDAVALNLAASKGQRPDSDGARAQAFLESKGYRVGGDDVAFRRLIHLADEARRHELLVIYLEPLGGTGLAAADLAPQGRSAARWPELSKKLLERATKGMKVSRRR